METNLDTTSQQNSWEKQLSISTGVKQYLAKVSTRRLWHVFLLANIGFALVYLLLNLFISWQWIGQNFAGFMHQNTVISHNDLPGWETREAKIGAIHLTEGDVILAVDDEPISSSQWLMEYVRDKPTGYPINYELMGAVGYDHEKDHASDITQTTIPVASFTTQNFIQLVAIPAFIAFISLIIVGSTVYLRSYRVQVRLFAFFTLALVYFLASFSEFIAGNFYVVNYALTFVGKVAMPIFLLHFLLLFPSPKRVLKDWPFLLPLIYFPLLPGLIHIPILFIYPETTYSFSIIIEAYTLLYTIIGLLLLADIMIKADNTRVRKQAAVLFTGLILPVLLLFGLISITDFSVDYELFHTVLGHYGFIGVPLAVAVAIIRYELFGIRRTNRSHFFFMVAIVAALLGYFLLLALISSISVNFGQFFSQDLFIIIITVLVFYLMQPLYKRTRDWLKQRAYGSTDDFKVGLRIFSHELLRASSRRDLEMLISWEIASDFRLKSAELVPTNRPTIPYALSLPLKLSNVELGTLFLGAKINGKDFTEEEQRILDELQRQLSLALWSIELDQAIQDTEQLTRLKSKFLANVTHELRTPLNGIINYVGFVLDDYRDTLNSEQIEYLEQAIYSAENLLQIINNILDMSKIEVGQMTLHLQPVELAEVVTETSEFVRPMIGNKPVELITEISPMLPIVQGDRLRLRQILLNMLTNAAKFTEAGKIRLRAYPDNGKVIIQVSDTGIGIDPKTLSTVFQQFVSTDLTDARRNFGPGLSMPITKSLVELHGGRVNVQSQPGQGTTFTVTLPVEPIIAQVATVQPPAS